MDIKNPRITNFYNNKYMFKMNNKTNDFYERIESEK